MYDLSIGVIAQLEHIVVTGAEDMIAMGLTSCQIGCWDDGFYTEENADKLTKMLRDKVQISAIWAGWPGPCEWNFIDGPLTLGLVPREYRAMRIQSLKKGADFAYRLGVRDVITHVGFIPENPATTEYRETVIAVREIAKYCKQFGQYFNFETGQETPTTLVRMIEDVGTGNLGVNLDPANLFLYGKGNAMDAIDIYKDRIHGVHIKDGCYPTNGRELGMETPVGEGMVDFSVIIKKLNHYGYTGALTIEREISGEQQIKDIIKAKSMLENILSNY